MNMSTHTRRELASRGLSSRAQWGTAHAKEWHWNSPEKSTAKQTSRPSRSDDSYTNKIGQRSFRSGLVSSNITKRLHNQTIGRQSRLKADITVPMEHTKAISMIEEIDRKREKRDNLPVRFTCGIWKWNVADSRKVKIKSSSVSCDLENSVLKKHIIHCLKSRKTMSCQPKP